MVECGMSPADVIIAATRSAAEPLDFSRSRAPSSPGRRPIWSSSTATRSPTSRPSAIAAASPAS